VNVYRIGSPRWCGSPGNCAIGYLARSRRGSGFTWQAWAVSEIGGTWHAPQAIPGMEFPGGSYVLSLSCSGPGRCVAAGFGLSEALVAAQQHGAWGSARPAPGLSRLRGLGGSTITGLSCSAAGWCAMAGAYWPPGSSQWGKGVRPFVAAGHDGA